MNAQTPVGLIPASKTVTSTIEVAILRGTLENCTLDSMRRANLHKGTDRSFACPHALGRMAIEVQNEYVGKSNKILSQQMVREMLTHQKDDWGLGFALESPGHKARFAHGGQNPGYRCDLEAYAEMGPGLVVMTNSDGGEFLIQELLR